MAMPHAHLLDVIDVRPLGADLAGAFSTSLLKTGRLQLLHLVLAAHQDVAEHHVADECCLHCLEGEVEVVLPDGVRRLGPGQLVVLPAGQRHGLRARSDCALLATLLAAGGEGGRGAARGAQSAP